MIYDQNKINEIAITNVMNGINEQLEFKATEEISDSINYLDLSINRNINKIELDIYRKPTNADITIEYTSNHPQDHKKAAFTFLHKQNANATHNRTRKKERMGKILNVAQKMVSP